MRTYTDLRTANADTKPEDEAAGKFAVVLCETCGPIQVNTAGECITNCTLHHHVGRYPAELKNSA